MAQLLFSASQGTSIKPKDVQQCNTKIRSLKKTNILGAKTRSGHIAPSDIFTRNVLGSTPPRGNNAAFMAASVASTSWLVQWKVSLANAGALRHPTSRSYKYTGWNNSTYYRVEKNILTHL